MWVIKHIERDPPPHVGTDAAPVQASNHASQRAVGQLQHGDIGGGGTVQEQRAAHRNHGCAKTTQSNSNDWNPQHVISPSFSLIVANARKAIKYRNAAAGLTFSFFFCKFGLKYATKGLFTPKSAVSCRT